MADASQFPVTTPYGQVAGYPLNNGFHNGVDYGCPTGTSVVVNGVTIGLSGNTGYTDGPHLHVGRWVGGTVTNPGIGGGFHFNSATVTEVSSDPRDGNFVRIQGDGASWVYLHLSKQLVKVGDVLKPTERKEEEMLDKVAVQYAYLLGWNRDPSAQEYQYWVGKKAADLLYAIYQSNNDFRFKAVSYDDLAAKTLNRDSVVKYLEDNLK